MHEHPNVKLIRKGYEGFHRGDVDSLRELMDPSVVWHEPGRSALSGDHKGPEGVLAFLWSLYSRSGGTFRAEIEDLLVDPERVVVFQHETAELDGNLLDVVAAVDFEIHRHKITEVTVYHGDQYRFDEFFSG